MLWGPGTVPAVPGAVLPLGLMLVCLCQVSMWSCLWQVFMHIQQTAQLKGCLQKGMYHPGEYVSGLWDAVC